MKKILPWLLFACSLVVIFCMQKCEKKEKTIFVKEKKGIFSDTIIKHDTIILTSPTRVKWKSKEILVYKEIDTTSVKNYVLMDSIAKLHAYIDSNTICEYNNAREDSLVRITVKGKVKSKIESMTIDYVIKPQRIDCDVKDSKYHIYIGMESTLSEIPVLKPSLYVDFGKKHGLTYSYDSSKRQWLGYRCKIF